MSQSEVHSPHSPSRCDAHEVASAGALKLQCEVWLCSSTWLEKNQHNGGEGRAPCSDSATEFACNLAWHRHACWQSAHTYSWAQ